MSQEIEDAKLLHTDFRDWENATPEAGESEVSFRVRYRAAELSHTKQLLLKENLLPGYGGIESPGTFCCRVKGVTESLKSYLERLYTARASHQSKHQYGVKNGYSHTQAMYMVEAGTIGLCRLFSDLSFKDDRVTPWKAAP